MIVARRAAVLAVALVLAGCGPNNAPAPTATAPLATPAPDTSASASAGAAAPSAAPAAAQPVVQYYLPAAAGTALAVTNTNLDTGPSAGDHAPGEQGQYAFDFGTDKNVPFTVVAARPGRVLGLQRGSATQCRDANTDADGTKDPGCWTKANYVLVDQGRGTAGLYMHLAPNSIPAGLTAGSPVCLGTPLGTDGQTGWATGPHVHFQVEATPTVPAPTAANPGVTDPNAIRPGWWWADSQEVAQGFSDPDVLARAPSGIPPRGSYTSGNPGIGCPGDSAPPAAPAITASWVAPKDGARLATSSLALSAKAAVTPSTLSVARVAFSVKWGSTTKLACPAASAGPGGVWSCKVDLWKLGAPLGKLTVSFDVADSAGDPPAKAPAGTRAVTFAAAPPTPKVTVTTGQRVGCPFDPTIRACTWVTLQWSALPDRTATVQASEVWTGEGGGTCANGLADLPRAIDWGIAHGESAAASRPGATTMRYLTVGINTGGGAFCGWYARSVNRFGSSKFVRAAGPEYPSGF